MTLLPSIKKSTIPAIILISIFCQTNYSIAQNQTQDSIQEYHVVSNPKSSFVLKGEQFETDFFVFPTPEESKEVYLFVNDDLIPIQGGLAKYRNYAKNLGENIYIARLLIKDPISKESIEVIDTFSYEVGERAMLITPNRMNVLYIGVDNPVSISVAGISGNKVRVSGIGCLIKRSGSGYIVRVTKPGEVTLQINAGGYKSTFKFRAKHIPDPSPMLGFKGSKDRMNVGEFKAQGGVAMLVENFDFDAKCSTVGYEVVRIAKDGKKEMIMNEGARFSDESRSLIEKAVSEDVYLFRSITCKCPGDVVNRSLQNFSIEVK